MKLVEIQKEMKRENPYKVIIFRYGVFYRAFGSDAYILWHFLKFQISDEERLGFPISEIDEVITKLNATNISYYIRKSSDEIIEVTKTDDTYKKLLKEAQKEYELYLKKEEVLAKIEKKIMAEPKFIDEINKLI